MAIVLVTGGTGHLGRDLVCQLPARRYAVRVLARTPGNDANVQWVAGDLATGAGIDEAARGVDAVMHAATFSPIARRGSILPIDFFTTPSEVDIDGTLRMLESAQRARVARFVHVSVVGLYDSRLPYSRVKLEGEKLVRRSPLDWSIVRAAPFYYLIERLLAKLRWLPVWLLPDALFDPVATSDVAAYLIECLEDGRRGVREEIGGPETLGLVEFARRYQSARGFHRPIVALHPSPERVRQMALVPAQGRSGSKTWAEWLSEDGVDASLTRAHAPTGR